MKKMEKKEKQAIMFHVAGAAAVLIATALALLFGLQGNLSIGERCHCSLTKVIYYTIADFLTVAVQLPLFFIAFDKRKDIKRADPNLQINRNKKKIKMMKFGWTLIAWGVCMIFIVLLPTLLIDQNHDILWLFRSGMGIFTVALTSIVTLVVGFLTKMSI